MVPGEGGPKLFKRKSSWHRSKILAVRGEGGSRGRVTPPPPAVYGRSNTALRMAPSLSSERAPSAQSLFHAQRLASPLVQITFTPSPPLLTYGMGQRNTSGLNMLPRDRRVKMLLVCPARCLQTMAVRGPRPPPLPQPPPSPPRARARPATAGGGPDGPPRQSCRRRGGCSAAPPPPGDMLSPAHAGQAACPEALLAVPAGHGTHRTAPRPANVPRAHAISGSDVRVPRRLRDAADPGTGAPWNFGGKSKSVRAVPLASVMVETGPKRPDIAFLWRCVGRRSPPSHASEPPVDEWSLWAAVRLGWNLSELYRSLPGARRAHLAHYFCIKYPDFNPRFTLPYRSPQGCIGSPPPPTSRAPSLCPATVPLTPSASFNGICHRQ